MCFYILLYTSQHVNIIQDKAWYPGIEVNINQQYGETLPLVADCGTDICKLSVKTDDVFPLATAEVFCT